MRLLVTDDNELNREMTTDVVEALGIEAISADSGETALEILRETKPDAVLMDYMMPGLDGAETTVKLHEIPGLESLPVIAMTAEEDPETIKALLEAGMCTVLHKPVEPVTLYKTLSELTDEELVKPKAPSFEGMSEDPVLAALDRLGFDVHAGIKFIGSLKSYRQYADDFSRLLPGMLDALRECMENVDYETFTVNIHGLKSNFRALGHNRLFKSAQSLEELGKNKAYDEMRSGYEKEAPAYYGLCAELEEVFENRERLAPFTDRELKGALTELRDAMKTFDLDTADVIVKDLKLHESRSDISEMIERLLREVTGIKYEAAMETIDTLLGACKGGQHSE